MSVKKCKPKNHVRVTIHDMTGDFPVFEAGRTDAVKQFCSCRQPVLGMQEVVVIFDERRDPDPGMHCLMELAQVLPGWLRTGANNTGPNQCVSIEHTVHGEFQPWRSFTVNGAFDLADKIAAVL